ncbi:MAG: RNA polymerase sigma factor [Anaerolineae bacterium]
MLTPSLIKDEEALVVAAKKGDVTAFNQLVLEYQQLAYNVAYRILGNEEKAMDATQDAFLRAFKALYQFQGGAFKPWILRIVTNCCYDQLRVGQRRPTTPIDDLVEDDEHSTILEDPSELPEEHAERQDLARAIQAGLNVLPEDQRVVLVMSDIHGMSYDQIAAATSVSLGTVKSRLSRGRAKLRDYLLAQRELLPRGYRLRNA